jgi:hypothetical protein
MVAPETRKLIELAKAAIAEGRKVVLFCEEPIGKVPVSMADIEDEALDLIRFTGALHGTGYVVKGSRLLGLKYPPEDVPAK